jgi:hypothetical protein
MITDSDSKIFESWREASQKFDYFVAGLIGALVAFIGQSFKPVQIGINPGTLELFSLLILVMSFLASFKRIESNTECLRLAFELNRLEDQVVGLLTTKESRTIAYSTQTGQPMTDVERETKIESLQTQYKVKNQSLNNSSNWAHRYYHWRNYLLIFGFVLLLVARVLKTYACAP